MTKWVLLVHRRKEFKTERMPSLSLVTTQKLSFAAPLLRRDGGPATQYSKKQWTASLLFPMHYMLRLWFSRLLFPEHSLPLDLSMGHSCTSSNLYANHIFSMRTTLTPLWKLISHPTLPSQSQSPLPCSLPFFCPDTKEFTSSLW